MKVNSNLPIQIPFKIIPGEPNQGVVVACGYVKGDVWHYLPGYNTQPYPLDII